MSVPIATYNEALDKLDLMIDMVNESHKREERSTKLIAKLIEELWRANEWLFDLIVQSDENTIYN